MVQIEKMEKLVRLGNVGQLRKLERVSKASVLRKTKNRFIRLRALVAEWRKVGRISPLVW